MSFPTFFRCAPPTPFVELQKSGGRMEWMGRGWKWQRRSKN